MLSDPVPAMDDTSLIRCLWSDILRLPKPRNAIFSCLTPICLHVCAQTDSVGHAAVVAFHRDAYDIDIHLLRFFQNPHAFRSLQAKTGTLISGSNALQFLSREVFPDADLDLYTHPRHTRQVGLWLIDEGYSFTPRVSDLHRMLGALNTGTWASQMTIFENTLLVYEAEQDEYDSSDIKAVYHFEKLMGSLRVPSKVQVIACLQSPLHTILNFHSSASDGSYSSPNMLTTQSACVMNFVAYDAAYSIYPRATFRDKVSVAFKASTPAEMRAHAKYEGRGWTTLPNLYDSPEVVQSCFVDVQRHVGDSMTWTLPLDISDLRLRNIFKWDPVEYNSWSLSSTVTPGRVVPEFFVVRNAVFQYVYLVATASCVNELKRPADKYATAIRRHASRKKPTGRKITWIW